MKEVGFWGLLGTFHYLILAAFVFAFTAELFFLKRILKRPKKTPLFIMVAILIGTGLGALVVRTRFFPGGGLYDVRYDFDRTMILSIQGYLESYREICNQYPTTSNGLQALVEKPSNTECPNYSPFTRHVPDLKYTSDGTSYEIESKNEYQIKGLMIRGTNDSQARFYIRR